MLYVNARFLTQKLTGVQRFAIELSLQLKEIYGKDIVFLSPKNIINNKLARELNVTTVGKMTGYLWEQIELPFYLYRRRNPILLNLCSVAPLFYNNNIVTVHDIGWVRYPHTYNKKFLLVYSFLIPRLCKRAKHIFTVSYFSLSEITEYYKIPSDKITIVYNSVDNSFKHITDSNLLKDKYIVAVSSIKENKNFRAVLQSFEIVQLNRKDIKLYIIGDVLNKNFRHTDLNAYRNNNNIKFLGRVTDEELIHYYSNAIAFVFPSIYEGFGIPVLEAQACGCPVISSNIESLKEVLQDSAVLCNPNDIMAIADNMLQLINDKSLRSSFVEKGYKNITRFSWRMSAYKVVEIIEKFEKDVRK